jgi:hypothetical protein
MQVGGELCAGFIPPRPLINAISRKLAWQSGVLDSLKAFQTQEIIGKVMTLSLVHTGLITGM